MIPTNILKKTVILIGCALVAILIVKIVIYLGSALETFVKVVPETNVPKNIVTIWLVDTLKFVIWTVYTIVELIVTVISNVLAIPATVFSVTFSSVAIWTVDTLTLVMWTFYTITQCIVTVILNVLAVPGTVLSMPLNVVGTWTVHTLMFVARTLYAIIALSAEVILNLFEFLFFYISMPLNAIGTILSVSLSTVVTWIGDTLTFLMWIVYTTAEFIVAVIPNIIRVTVNDIAMWIVDTLTFIMWTLYTVAEFVVTAISNVTGIIKTTVMTVVTAISTLLLDIISYILWILYTIVSYLGDVISNVTIIVTSTTTTILTPITILLGNIISSMFLILYTIVSYLGDVISNVTIIVTSTITTILTNIVILLGNIISSIFLLLYTIVAYIVAFISNIVLAVSFGTFETIKAILSFIFIIAVAVILFLIMGALRTYFNTISERQKESKRHDCEDGDGEDEKGKEDGRYKNKRRTPMKDVMMPTGRIVSVTIPAYKCSCSRIRATKLIPLRLEGRMSRVEYRIVTEEMNNTIKSHVLQAQGGGVFTKYEIVSIHKVRNCCLWTKYLNRQQDITKEGVEVNERMLFHGSMAADDIVMRGFDERRSNSGGMFGAGVYFAEHSSKSNQYVFGYLGGNGCGKHGDKSCYVCQRKMLLCRVSLGKTHQLTSANKMSHPPPGYDSVAGKPSPGGLQYPEYVIYRGEQAYPEYLITYKIVR